MSSTAADHLTGIATGMIVYSALLLGWYLFLGYQPVAAGEIILSADTISSGAFLVPYLKAEYGGSTVAEIIIGAHLSGDYATFEEATTEILSKSHGREVAWRATIGNAAVSPYPRDLKRPVTYSFVLPNPASGEAIPFTLEVEES